MSGDIVLSAGVRQNLLSLQGTAQLMSLTQNRLATGKKVNSALDNPSSFFISQALSFRASDLNSLLDAIGQGQKILEASDKGLTSLTKLVESAKATARQARQAPHAPTSYAAVATNSDISLPTNLNGSEIIAATTGNIGIPPTNASPQALALAFTTQTEQLGRHQGGAVTVANSAVYTYGISVNGGATQTVNFTSDATATFAEISAGLLADLAVELTAAGVAGSVAQTDTGTALILTSTNADIDFTITAASANTGLTNAAYASTSLLDRVVAGGGTAGSSLLTIDVNGGPAAGGTTKAITFGTGVGQISTFADLNTELSTLLGGATGNISGGAFAGIPPVNTPVLNLAEASGQFNSIGLTLTDAGVRTALGLTAARAAGQTGGLGTSLTRTFNSAATLSDLDPTNLAFGGNFTISVNSSPATVSLSATDRLDDIITKLRANSTLNNSLTFANTGGELQITAKTADADFTVSAGFAQAALGLATAAQNSTSLFDRLATKLGSPAAAQGSTLTVAVNGGATQSITFGTGATEVSTQAEFTTALTNLYGVTASLTGPVLNLQVETGTAATSLTLGGSALTAFGLAAGTTAGALIVGPDNATRANLQSDYNNVLTQIDALAKDSSYNGINLLNGDNLKIVFNETNTSSLNITGVVFDSAGLALNPVAGTAFQNDTTIETTMGQLDAALTALRTQASKFGSSLTTVQVRQEFTKQLITTLQTGADALVLADTNEEGANLLALQTRQQLSTTALSLSAQADQAVLRLFG